MVAGQQGDRGAYRQLLIAVEAWTRRFLADAVPSADVERAIADTLLAVHKSRHTYGRSQKFERWLTAIATDKRDRYGARKRTARAKGP
jgi:DNA-directed RNA polymerase specialized sigma24 family protein